jgi:hypothetical protein
LSQAKGFVTHSKAFKSYYGGFQAFFNEAEWRAKLIYDRLQLGIKPWEWDQEHYSGEYADMIGFFYPEDIANIEMIDKMEKQYRAHHNG